tara:strand:- start:263 stop:619 length:357 start_codon:yes stop_codon:yes gene_type:complete
MSSKYNWKVISHQVTKMHTELGGSLVMLSGSSTSDRPLVNTSPEEQIGELVGNKLTPKSVRRFLWTNRKSRQVQRPNAIVWSWYDPEEDKTFIGLGAVVGQRQILRGLINPDRVISDG